MPIKRVTPHTAEQLRMIRDQLRHQTASLESVAEMMDQNEIETLGCTTFTELKRGLRGIESFVHSARVALVERISERLETREKDSGAQE